MTCRECPRFSSHVEPKCSMRVIADELVNINSSLRDIRRACEKGRL